MSSFPSPRILARFRPLFTLPCRSLLAPSTTVFTNNPPAKRTFSPPSRSFGHATLASSGSFVANEQFTLTALQATQSNPLAPPPSASAMAPSAVEVEHIGEITHKLKLVTHNLDDHVAFGGDNQWYYHVPSKRFDLSRGSKRKIVIDADDGIRNHRGVMIDPEQSVLVIIDMQNYFIHPKYREHTGGIAAIDPLVKVIKRCREQGIQLAWVNWGITEHDLKVMPAAVQRGFNRALVADKGHGWHVGLGAELPDGEGRCLFKGTWNADIYAPLKELMIPSDVCFDKARMSGLWSPELEMHKWLRESGKKTLLFAGVNTDQCLLGTLTDAYNWGWDCVLVGDCAATMTGLEAQAVCDYNIATNMGFVTDSQAFLDAEIIG